MKEHFDAISVESELGSGSSFTLKIPLNLVRDDVDE